MNHYELTPCNQTLNSFIFLLEGNTDVPVAHSVEIHLTECPDCTSELVHERQMHTLVQDVLRRTCCEIAPDDLHDSIYRQIHSRMAGAFTTEVITEFTMTEISIEIDEFGTIEHREITIEHSEEIRYRNGAPESDER